jgi:hypothetical protein
MLTYYTIIRPKDEDRLLAIITIPIRLTLYIFLYLSYTRISR